MAPRKPRSKRTTVTPTKPHWRNFPDSGYKPFNKLPCAPSLRPGLPLMQACVDGSSVARAIVEAWNPALFLSKFIVVVYE